MNIIGIHYGHNCTLGFSRNGIVVSLLGEERLCRIKNATGFPFQALNEIVNLYLNGNHAEIDLITTSDGDGSLAEYCIKEGVKPKGYIDYYWKSKELLLQTIHKSNKQRIKDLFFSFLSQVKVSNAIGKTRRLASFRTLVRYGI